jgi:hypothetical protein
LKHLLRTALVSASLVLTAGAAVARAQVEVVHSFSGDTDPAVPISLIEGTGDFLYGLTSSGGATHHGTAWKMTTDGLLTVCMISSFAPTASVRMRHFFSEQTDISTEPHEAKATSAAARSSRLRQPVRSECCTHLGKTLMVPGALAAA